MDARRDAGRHRSPAIWQPKAYDMIEMTKLKQQKREARRRQVCASTRLLVITQSQGAPARQGRTSMRIVSGWSNAQGGGAHVHADEQHDHGERRLA